MGSLHIISEEAVRKPSWCQKVSAGVKHAEQNSSYFLVFILQWFWRRCFRRDDKGQHVQRKVPRDLQTFQATAQQWRLVWEALSLSMEGSGIIEFRVNIWRTFWSTPHSLGDRIPLCSPGCSGINYIVQARWPSYFTPRVLGLQTYHSAWQNFYF